MSCMLAMTAGRKGEGYVPGRREVNEAASTTPWLRVSMLDPTIMLARDGWYSKVRVRGRWWVRRLALRLEKKRPDVHPRRSPCQDLRAFLD